MITAHRKGGGQVNIGGSREGKGPLPNADAVWLSPESSVTADATDNGDGGTIIVFGHDYAGVHADLKARGGPNGGNGGFIETSGLEAFDISISPDVSSPVGLGGEWLIDPFDIFIVAGAILSLWLVLMPWCS